MGSLRPPSRAETHINICETIILLMSEWRLAMRKSARYLGRDVGLNAEEMNVWLKEEGYLEVEPGDYRVTEKGRPYATQRHWETGSPNHAGYVSTSWKEEILNEIGPLSPERRRELSDSVAANRAEKKRQREEWEASLAANGDDSLDDGQRDGNDASDSNGGKVAAAAITVIAVSFLAVKGAQAAKPHVEKWWRETARPKIVKTKKNVMAKFKGVSDEQGEEADPKTTEKTAD